VKLERDGWCQERKRKLVEGFQIEREGIWSNNTLLKKVYKVLKEHFMGMLVSFSAKVGISSQEAFNELFLFVSEVVIEKFPKNDETELRWFIGRIASFWKKKYLEALSKYKGRFRFASEFSGRDGEEDFDIFDEYIKEAVVAVRSFEDSFVEFVDSLDDIREEVLKTLKEGSHVSEGKVV